MRGKDLAYGKHCIARRKGKEEHWDFDWASFEICTEL